MLKNNYMDALFDGQRRYRMAKNEDGTYSFQDKTTYTQEGDRFGANDANDITGAINRIDNTIEVTLPRTGWSDAAPYKQRVAVPGIKATDEPGLLLNAPQTLSATDVKLRVKCTAMITDGDAEDGYMTFWCGVKKPDVDFSVKLEGVSVNGEA